MTQLCVRPEPCTAALRGARRGSAQAFNMPCILGQRRLSVNFSAFSALHRAERDALDEIFLYERVDTQNRYDRDDDGGVLDELRIGV
jgi:hypothetical protein